MTRTKILIVNYFCASNRGDAAILDGTISALKKYFDCPEISVLTNYPNSAKIIHNINVYNDNLNLWPRNYKKIMGIFYLIVMLHLTKRNNCLGIEKIIRKLSLGYYVESDLIISVGGSYLNDFYIPHVLEKVLRLYIAKLLNKPVIIYAQSIGPLYRKPYQQIIKHVLNQMDLITVRDKQSLKNLNYLGINKPPIYLTADAAFSINFDFCKPINLWKNEQERFLITKSPLKVSISVRKWPFYGQNIHQQYIKNMAQFTDWLIKEKKAQVIFASTCTGLGGYHHDDRVVAHDIINQMKFAKNKNPTILYGEYTPAELINFFSFMDCHIGTRMHSNVLALMAKTPVIAIQYEFKTADLMTRMGLKNYLLDIKTLDFNTLKKTFDLLNNDNSLYQTISINLERMKELSENNAKLIYNLFKNKR